MTAFWPGCCCEPSTCAVLSPTNLKLNTYWSVLAGSWDAPTGVLSGTSALAVTTASTTYPQYATFTITANAANQVLDILLGCDAAGAPSMFVRITFGDSSVSANDCGSMQLFDSTGTAYEDVQPVYSLVNGTAYTLTICTDSTFGRFYAKITNRSGDSTALITSDPGGRLGLRLQNAQSGTMTIVPTIWERIWISSQTCRNCRICGTGPDGVTISNSSVSTCTHTMATPYYFGPNIIGMGSIDVLTVISELDRQQGYGVAANGASLISTTDPTSLEVYADNNHWSARISISPRITGACAGGSTAYHMDYTVELMEDGVAVASSTGCVGFAFSGAEQFTFSAKLVFCDGTITATGNLIVGIASSSNTASVSGDQVGDGSAHGATTESYGSNAAGVTSITTTRCLDCSYCEECDELVPSPTTRSYSVEVTGTPYDGTHVLTGTICGAAGTGGGIPWTIAVRRHNFLLTGGTGGSAFSGVSSGPLPDCDSLNEVEVTLSGPIAYTIVVATIQDGSGSQNEKQSIKFNPISPLPAAGTFTLSLGFNTTAAIAYNASNATVQAALEALASIGSGNVVITGTVGDWVAEFVGAKALTNMSQMSGSSSLSSTFSGLAKITSV